MDKIITPFDLPKEEINEKIRNSEKRRATAKACADAGMCPLCHKTLEEDYCVQFNRVKLLSCACGFKTSKEGEKG